MDAFHMYGTTGNGIWNCRTTIIRKPRHQHSTHIKRYLDELTKGERCVCWDPALGLRNQQGVKGSLLIYAQSVLVVYRKMTNQRPVIWYRHFDLCCCPRYFSLTAQHNRKCCWPLASPMPIINIQFRLFILYDQCVLLYTMFSLKPDKSPRRLSNLLFDQLLDLLDR
jgi:hypothetical protein